MDKISIIKKLIATMQLLLATLMGNLGNLGAIGATTDIAEAENSYFQSNGKYLQIVKGELPHYENGTDKSKLGIDVPSNVSIHVYKTSKGEQGYQVITENSDSIGSVGYGIQAAERTYTIDRSVTPKTASSTP